MKKKNEKNRKDKFNLREQYYLSWKYIKNSKKFICSAVIIFLTFMILGFFISPSEVVSNRILEFIKNILAETNGFNKFQMIKYILLNNLKSSFFSLFLGAIFGIVPFFASVFNGYLVGFVASMAVDQAGFATLLNLVPHGIFELPAIFISLGLGFKLGGFIFYKDRAESFRTFLLEGLRVFIFVILPLLIIAAIIEGSLI